MLYARFGKLFAILRHPSLRLYGVNWKFIDEDRIFKGGIPSSKYLLDDRFGDIFNFPYVEYREIDWIEIPKSVPDPRADSKRSLPEIKNDLTHLKKFIESHNTQFHIQTVDSGLRIIGYTW